MKKILSIFLVMILMLGSFSFAEKGGNNSGKSNENNSQKSKIEKVEKIEKSEKIDAKIKLESSSEEDSESITNLKKSRNEKRIEARARYTKEEMVKFNKAKKDLEDEYEGIKVLEADSVISSTRKFKFDTPPVIKEGRTLIPVRAITEGLGAEVAWDSELKKVTISKDDTVIELLIGEETVYVNGDSVVMDTYAEIMNSRTIVPLRFIAETLGLEVKWNPEDESIEIEEAEEALEEAKEELEAAKKTAEEAELSLEKAEEKLVEAKEVLEEAKKLEEAKELEAAEAEVAKAEAEAKEAEEELEKAKEALEEAKKEAEAEELEKAEALKKAEEELEKAEADAKAAEEALEEAEEAIQE